MKPSALSVLVCPACKGSLDLSEGMRLGGEVLEGELDCRGCAAVYAVRRGVPRFVSAGGYAGSFAHQWRHFRSVQLDSLNGRDESNRTFRATTGWTAEGLRGRVLQFVSPISMHPHWRARWLDTFDWYTPKYRWKHSHPEVFEWFRENGCADVEIAKEPIRMRGVRAGVSARAPSP
jgi:uncharacterized protein YbaR (Trm112 family)